MVTAGIEVLKQCKTIKQLHQLHAHTITSGLRSSHSTSQFLNSLLHAFTTLLSVSTHYSPSFSSVTAQNLLTYAVFVFSSIPSLVTTASSDSLHSGHERLSTFCFNNIIRAHTLLSSPVPALLFFARMRGLAVPPDAHTFPFALKACTQFRSFPLSQTLHAQAFKFGFVADLFVQNALIHVYCICGRLDLAHHLFDHSSNRDVVSYNALLHGFVKAGDIIQAYQLFNCMPTRDTVSWGTIIAGYSQSNQPSVAIQLFTQMLDFRLRPDNVAIVSALSACARLGELQQGKLIHDYIIRNRIVIDSFLATGLVDLYAKCGCIEIATDIFHSCPVKNLVTWNALLGGFALHGHGHEAVNSFCEMVAAGIQPDGISVLGVLVGCSHAGLVDEARKLFDDMELVHGVRRERKHYGCMADLLGRAGLIQEAEELIKSMPMVGDVYVWGGLLGGCRIHGNLQAAEKAAQRVREVKPDDGGVYSVMADIYANMERWEDVVNIRTLIKANRVKKNAACSAIQF